MPAVIIDNNPTPQEISDILSYVLANLGSAGNADALIVDVATGRIYDPNQPLFVISYLYRYLAVRYADNSTGTLNFSNNPANRLYYGLRNTNFDSESTNPADYVWYEVTNGFGATRLLYYRSYGGRSIDFIVSDQEPTGYMVVPTTSIDLDIITASSVRGLVYNWNPESLPIPVNRDGSGGVYGQDVVFSLFVGDSLANLINTDSDGGLGVLTYRITGDSEIGVVISNRRYNYDANTITFTVNNLTQNTGYVELFIRYKDINGLVEQIPNPIFVAYKVMAGKEPLTLDVSGITGFSKDASNVFTPPTATLTAITSGFSVVPVITWTVNGATTSSSTGESITITPLPSASMITLMVHARGASDSESITKNYTMSVSQDGANGVFVDISGATGFSKSITGVYTPVNATLNAITNIPSPSYSWSINGASPSSGSSSSITIAPNNDATDITATVTVSGTGVSPISKTVGMSISFDGQNGMMGPAGPLFATTYLYQYNINTPAKPTGTGVFTWSTLSATYSGTDDWQATAPANIGTPGLTLYIATLSIMAPAGTTTSNINWSSSSGSVQVSVVGRNGDAGPGVQFAQPKVYQQDITIPAIAGSSTYTWSNGNISPIPSGWLSSPPTPIPGQTIWTAEVDLTATASTVTSTINWVNARISGVYNGANGQTNLQGRTAYGRVPFSDPTVGNVTVSGDTPPTGAQASAVWGAPFNVTWSTTDPDPASNNSLYVIDGLYNTTTNMTTWTTPYLASLKVGNLSAITVNTGNLNVSGTITVFGGVSSNRMYMDTTGISIYANNVLRVKIGDI